MLVRDRMSTPVITVTPETNYPDAKSLMAQCDIRRLVVVDGRGRLVGILSQQDLLQAAPSSATTLSIWEVNGLLATMRIGDLMSRGVLTATPDMPIEEAAQIMLTHKVGGLPVVDGQKQVVGIITESDIFRALVTLFGGGEPGLRVELAVPPRDSVLLEAVGAIYGLGGQIVSVGSYENDIPAFHSLYIKVQGVERGELVDALELLGDRVMDVRSV